MDEFDISIMPCNPVTLDEVVTFIASLNRNAQDHIGYFDSTADDIRRSLNSLTLPINEGFRLALSAGQIVGVLGVEADVEIGRAWIYGPLMRHPHWMSIADQLYAAVLPAIPDGIRQHQLFCDSRNQNCRAFAARHGFEPLSESAQIVLDRADFNSASSADILPIGARYFDQFCDLHPRLMSNAYFTAQQILDRLNEDSHLLIAAEGDELLGYVYFQAGPGVSEAYIDFVAVAESARRRGVGTQLVLAAAEAVFAWPHIEQVRLSVNTMNLPAVRLYDQLGFQRERTMMGFSRNVVAA